MKTNYVIVAIELISNCLYCQTQYCQQCLKYGTNSKIFKILTAAPTYNQILYEYRELENKRIKVDNRRVKYQIHKIEPLTINDLSTEDEYAILETVHLINDGSVENNEIIFSGKELKQLQLIYQNIITGKRRVTSHFNIIPLVHFVTYELVKLSKELPTAF